MENFFKFFSNIFSNSNEEEENKLDNEIFLSNIQYSFKMKKNRKVNSFININKEKCPKCSSEFLSKKYCHFHSNKNIDFDKINFSKLNYDNNLLSNNNNNQQNFWDNINISPIKKDNKVNFEKDKNMNINNNNSNDNLFKEESNKKINVVQIQIINEEDEKIFKLFGFKNFSSSKNKSHTDSDLSGAFFGKYVKRIYSQYMNKGINPKKRIAILQQNNITQVNNNTLPNPKNE
jgi:hypothetical protein